MRVRTAFLVCVALLLCSMGWSQANRLGDVAGSIKLNPKAIVEKDGVVVDPRAAKRADENLFGSVLADCSAVADLLGELVAQARQPAPARDPELMNRLNGVSIDLETEVRAISLLRLTGVFKQPLETAREAVDICTGACTRVREEVAGGGVMFRNADMEVTRCRQLLDQAKAEVVAADNPPGADSMDSAGLGNAAPLTDDAIIATKCESERSKGIDSFDACKRIQYLSQAAIASRSADNEMLDQGVFSDIRHLCRELHPQDFVLRDGCEQDKMTTARLELE